MCSPAVPTASLVAVNGVTSGTVADAGEFVENCAVWCYASSNTATGQQVQLMVSWDGSTWGSAGPVLHPGSQPGAQATSSQTAIVGRYFRVDCVGAPSNGTVTAYVLPF